jgi:hypothetical protein
MLSDALLVSHETHPIAAGDISREERVRKASETQGIPTSSLTDIQSGCAAIPMS